MQIVFRYYRTLVLRRKHAVCGLGDFLYQFKKKQMRMFYKSVVCVVYLVIVKSQSKQTNYFSNENSGEPEEKIMALL